MPGASSVVLHGFSGGVLQLIHRFPALVEETAGDWRFGRVRRTTAPRRVQEVVKGTATPLSDLIGHLWYGSYLLPAGRYMS
ncbi:hypothetical protein CONLIGDRAFT_86125 [Coniochaeta ligniaria NRRL 30616]|uniref:Uncharacterized protein n=1 Tax=Coniochaeta ligniaria NRRL 30616 TaxID=1408157 RepID=A0A1J7IC07_9PEZI|nr:hypothetical protein CONLIGDRAFT_86125 [Coniochaeta ligniaria NRRL 30616]